MIDNVREKKKFDPKIEEKRISAKTIYNSNGDNFKQERKL